MTPAQTAAPRTATNPTSDASCAASDPCNAVTNASSAKSGSALTLVLLATAALAMKGLLAKFVYATGMTVDGLLLLRFLIAMPFFWLGVWMFGKHRPGDRSMRRTDLLWGPRFAISHRSRSLMCRCRVLCCSVFRRLS